MNQWKQKKSLCFLLMICILFLGMCIDNNQADSFFSYESSVHTASTLLGKGTTLTAQEYTIESISKDEYFTGSCQIARRSFSPGNKGTSLSLLFVDILPQNSSLTQISSDIELADESSCSTVIVNYIHHKDGKKA